MKKDDPGAAGRPSVTATILFTDVEGSTELRSRLGDVAADEILGEAEPPVGDVAHHHLLEAWLVDGHDPLA